MKNLKTNFWRIISIAPEAAIKMVSEKRLKGRGKVRDEDRKNKTMMWIIIVLMVLSVAGFAFMTGGSQYSGEEGSELPSEIPLQQFEQQGQVFWGAVRNSEQFVFQTIDGFEENFEMKNLAEQIKGNSVVTIYVAPGFQSSDSIYIIEKALRGVGVNFERGAEPSCEEGSLILTNNESYEGNCLYFSANEGEEYSQAEVLTYHLVKE